MHLHARSQGKREREQLRDVSSTKEHLLDETARMSRMFMIFIGVAVLLGLVALVYLCFTDPRFQPRPKMSS